MTDTMRVSDEDFRKVGFTSAARNFPLSVSAQILIATLNGIDFVQMPDAWRFAPNAYMQRWMEWLAQQDTIWADEAARKLRTPPNV